MQLDYTFERQIELEREAATAATGRAWKQGMERGIERGRLREIIAFVQDGDISVERGAQKAGMTVDEFKKVMAANS